ncbi:hypothetical protein Fcan01_28571 [Folsomia candida]|uniref:Uncharacterized protein n=1 Tax=Folsomia candida TaxID=158441 RepID=A0A226CT51_FOLCA|nr:hypothetical protein Fcan01_28571 [Folsomia candida]
MPPVTARDSERARFTPLGLATKVKRSTFTITLKESEKTQIPKLHEKGKPKSCHSYKSETEHFYDNFKGIRENSEIPKLHEKGKPKSCMSCQMPPVTARDSGKGAFYAPRNRENSEIPKLHEKGKPKSCMSCQMPPVTVRDSERAVCTPLGHSYKSETEHFYDNFKGIRKTPKYRKLQKRENLNLVCPAKCHPLQLETPERARFTPLGHSLQNVKRSTFTITLKESEKTPKYRNYMKRENLNLVCPAKCHPLQLETPERARFTPLGHSYKSETEHFYDNFKGIRENSEIPKLHEKGKPKSCMSCQMPPVTARDSGKGAFYAPRCGLESHDYKSETEHFAITLKESEKTPKYRNYMKRENLNLVCPAKCHPLQLETPERARCTPLGVDLKLETPERARFTPLGHSYKSETEHFYDNFKGIRENSEIPKLHEKGKPKSVCPAKCHPLQLETPERARFTPLGHSYKVKRSTFTITLKESEKTPKYRNYMKRENLNLVCPAKCHPLQLETPERARFTPLGVDLKVYNQL